MNRRLYDKSFYQMIRTTSEASVEPVLKILKKYYHGEIHSAIDLGCGIGLWLKGIKEIFDINAKVRGYDGEYVAKEELVINEDEFIPWDLQNKVKCDENYDIAISLEVAEHLSKNVADEFVESLVELSDVILFSAALPNQSGVGHINEQPLSYWVQKFDKNNYEFYDIIRPAIWNNEKISVWYKQNIVVFVKRNSKASFLIDNIQEKIIDIVHPALLQEKENSKVFKEYHALWRCYRQVENVRDLFDSLPDKGIAIRMGGVHTKKLLSLIGKKNRRKIEAIIDVNPDCTCKNEGYPIVGVDNISLLSNFQVIVLSSFKKRTMLLNEKKSYPKGIKIIDIYQYLEENNCLCTGEFFE